MAEKIIPSYKSVIFLDGDLPPKKDLLLLNKSSSWIAADGAANRLKTIGLAADYIIGDGDSCSKEDCKKIRIDPNQDTTDFEKCIAFVKNKKLTPTLVLGMSGGEIDHILGNYLALIKHGFDHSLFAIDYSTKGYKLAIPLFDTLNLSLKTGSKVSILPYSSAIITSHGLKWELMQTELSTSSILGIRNEAILPKIELKIEQGIALIIAEIESLSQAY